MAEIARWKARSRLMADSVGADLEHPDRAAPGIEHVTLNGTPVLERGKYRADALAGRVLRASPG